MGLIGRLGDLKFEISEKRAVTFAALQEKYSYKITTHEVIGQPPSYEITGIEANTTILNLIFSVARGVNPSDYVRKINKLLNQKKALPLMIGDQFHGNFLLKSAEYLGSSYDQKGNAWKIEANLEIMRDGWLK